MLAPASKIGIEINNDEQNIKLTPTMHKNLILPVDLKTVYPS